jgi:glycosyltransferase involved in cell wall biosynthesis
LPTPVSESSGLDFSIIIPAYNESAAIGKVLKALIDEPALQNAEIIVVDDCSKDTTAEITRGFPQVRLLQHRMNKGYSSAIKTGTKAALGTFVVWYDADGQHQVKDLVKVMTALKEHDLDYCIGVRNSKSHRDFERRLGKFLLRMAVQMTAGRHINDFNSGLRGFKREVLVRYLHLLPKGFGASTTTTLLMLERGYYGEEVPITVLKRVGKSSVRQLRDGFRTLTIIMRLFLLFKPMKFFGSIGFLLLILGSAYGLERALTLRQGVPVLSALIIILGIITIFIGLISDQISTSRLERLE